MKRSFGLLAIFLFAAGAVTSSACRPAPKLFRIISGSENETLEPLIRKFERSNRVEIRMTYKGSVDIMRELRETEFNFDAVWPANSLWIDLGDRTRRVKYAQSMVTSPVVFAIRRSVADRLGFVGRKVRVRDVLEAIRRKELRFMMTSATQSNSGASAYFGFLYALLGNPEMLTREQLLDEQLSRDIKDLLSGIHRGSGSSGWLKDLFLASDYDAMVNYEALVIEANQELIRRGREPLYVIYPVDGIVISDSPLGYVGHGEAWKEDIFRRLQEFLLSEASQAELSRLGRRTGLGGIVGPVSADIFNPDWGIDIQRILSPIKLPSADVILEALNLYQTEFRKPSLTVFCLDYSGSMKGEGNRQLQAAMDLLLDQAKAATFLLQASRDDRMTVVPFGNAVIDNWTANGGDSAGLAAVLAKVRELKPGGSTDIYTPAIFGLKEMAGLKDLDRYIPAVILMTDGQSNTGMKFDEFAREFRALGLDIPVFCIMFGDASESQLNDIVRLTRGRVFDGRRDLVGAFRQVKGYN